MTVQHGHKSKTKVDVKPKFCFNKWNHSLLRHVHAGEKTTFESSPSFWSFLQPFSHLQASFCL